MSDNAAVDRLNALVSKLVAAIRPPPNVTVSEWAAQNRVLSPEASAEQGRWRNSRTPYLVEIMDAYSDPRVHHIVVVASSQVGKSEFENNVIGRTIDVDPGSILFIHPVQTDAKEYSKLRIAPMIRDCPTLRANTPAAPAAQSNEGGQSTMANNANPTPATTAAENPQAAVDAAVSAERNRLAEIDSVASLFDPALVQEAKYGETACDARELAFRAAKAAAAQGHEFLKNLAADNAASGAQNVEAVPGASASGSPESLPDAKGNVPKTQAERMAAAEAAVAELLDDDKK